jgi:hypothetical protein
MPWGITAQHFSEDLILHTSAGIVRRRDLREAILFLLIVKEFSIRLEEFAGAGAASPGLPRGAVKQALIAAHRRGSVSTCMSRRGLPTLPHRSRAGMDAGSIKFNAKREKRR